MCELGIVATTTNDNIRAPHNEFDDIFREMLETVKHKNVINLLHCLYKVKVFVHVFYLIIRFLSLTDQNKNVFHILRR